MRKRKVIDVFEGICLAGAVIGYICARGKYQEMGFMVSSLFLVCAYALSTIANMRMADDCDARQKLIDSMEVTKLSDDVTIEQLRESVKFWQNKAFSDVAMGGTLDKEGDFKLHSLALVADPLDSICVVKPVAVSEKMPDVMHIHTAKKRGSVGIVNANGDKLVHKKSPKPIYPELLVREVIGAVRMNEDDPTTEKELVERLKKKSREIAEFVNKVEDAHEKAADSKLVFGEDTDAV